MKLEFYYLSNYRDIPIIQSVVLPHYMGIRIGNHRLFQVRVFLKSLLRDGLPLVVLLGPVLFEGLGVLQEVEDLAVLVVLGLFEGLVVDFL